jgi:HTH-type transcriptional regulator/antitoxin HigA
MATKTRARRGRDDIYLELVRAFPLRPLRDDADLDRAITVIDSLLDRKTLGRDEEDYLDVLSDLVHKYETKAYPIGPVSDADLLRHLLEARGIAQADVAAGTGIAESTVSEVLAGKRKLNRRHIAALAKFFHVSPAVFIAEP